MLPAPKNSSVCDSVSLMAATLCSVKRDFGQKLKVMVVNRMCESENITCATGEGRIHENTDRGIQRLRALKDAFSAILLRLSKARRGLEKSVNM